MVRQRAIQCAVRSQAALRLGHLAQSLGQHTAHRNLWPAGTQRQLLTSRLHTADVVIDEQHTRVERPCGQHSYNVVEEDFDIHRLGARSD